MNEPQPPADYGSEQSPARTVAGALAHLATHMETGCPRAAWLAAMLLERVAADPDADAHLRNHARELVDILERDADAPPVAAARRTAAATPHAAPPGDRHGGRGVGH